MRWECPDCGETLDRAHAPSCCPECGTAVTLTRSELRDLAVGENLREAWIRAGMERGFLRAT